MIRDLLFASDCALASHTTDGIQTIAESFSSAAKALTINIKKTELLYQPRPHQEIAHLLKVFIDGNPLKQYNLSPIWEQQLPATLKWIKKSRGKEKNEKKNGATRRINE